MTGGARSGPPRPPVCTILGAPVHAVTRADTLALVAGYMGGSRLHQICTTNPEFVMAARRDPLFRQVLRAADLCIPDGIGLVLASRWLGRPLPERVPGSELVFHLAAASARHHWRPFLLGAPPGVAAETAVILQQRYPGLQVAGTYAGSPDPAENRRIVALINDSRADLLLVAYGAPRQDKWIYRNRRALTTVRVALGVGGSFDFITGRAVRAPAWVQNLGLEWLHRLWREPWRWRRMLALPHFALRVLLSRRPAG